MWAQKYIHAYSPQWFIQSERLSPAKSFTFTSAPSLMSSLMRRTSPRIAALCSRVSPLSLRLFTLSLVLDAEFGVPFCPRLDCDWCFGVVSVGKRWPISLQQFYKKHIFPLHASIFCLILSARRGQSHSSNQNGAYFTWAHFITFTRLNPNHNQIYIIGFAQLLSQIIFEICKLNLCLPLQAWNNWINM